MVYICDSLYFILHSPRYRAFVTTLYNRATHTYVYTLKFIYRPYYHPWCLSYFFTEFLLFFSCLLSHYTRLASPFQTSIYSAPYIYLPEFLKLEFRWRCCAVGAFFIVGASYLFRVLPIYIWKLLACLANGNIIFCVCPKCVSLGKRRRNIFAYSNCLFHFLWKVKRRILHGGFPNEGNHLRNRPFSAFRYLSKIKRKHRCLLACGEV